MSKPKEPELLPRSHQDVIDKIVARTRGSLDPATVQPTFEKEIMQILLEDNRALVAEVERLQQQVLNLRIQLRLENVRELERQFPRKGRRKSR